MKKKIVSLCLVAALAATAVVGGSLAYFTDTDGAKNVMTVGNVAITQDETNEKGEPFQDGQKLYPYTGTGADDAANKITINDAYYQGGVMDPAKNWISKIVTVMNDGTEDAYVRTLFAFQILEDADGKEIIAADPYTGDLAWRAQHGLNYNLYQCPGSVYFPKVNNDYVKYEDADGNKYIVGEYLYMNNGDSMLKGSATTGTVGERSHASLKSIALESYVDNDAAALYEDYKILVVSQAVQTKGFTDDNGNGVISDDALNTAFGALAEADQTKLEEWFANAQ